MGPPGSRRPQMGPMMAPWTLLSGKTYTSLTQFYGTLLDYISTGKLSARWASLHSLHQYSLFAAAKDPNAYGNSLSKQTTERSCIILPRNYIYNYRITSFIHEIMISSWNLYRFISSRIPSIYNQNMTIANNHYIDITFWVLVEIQIQWN